MNTLNLRPTAYERSSLITIGRKISNGEKCALSVVNATITACKRYLANLKLIPSNMVSGITVEYTMSEKYHCCIRFRFYSKCDLQSIDRWAERIQRDLTAIFAYYCNVASVDLKLRELENNLMLNISTMCIDLDFMYGQGAPKEALEHMVPYKAKSKALGRGYKAFYEKSDSYEE